MDVDRKRELRLIMGINKPESLIFPCSTNFCLDSYGNWNTGYWPVNDGQDQNYCKLSSLPFQKRAEGPLDSIQPSDLWVCLVAALPVHHPQSPVNICPIGVSIWVLWYKIVSGKLPLELSSSPALGCKLLMRASLCAYHLSKLHYSRSNARFLGCWLEVCVGLSVFVCSLLY